MRMFGAPAFEAPVLFLCRKDGLEEQEKCRKRIKTDAHDNPFVAAGKLAGWILQGSTQAARQSRAWRMFGAAAFEALALFSA